MLFHKLSENVRKFFSMFDRRAWTIIGTLMLANFVNTITFNCMDAFYPKEAHNRQIDTGHIGIVIGTYQLSRFLMAPFAGKYIMSVGPTLAFFFGLFVTAATAFGFGLLTLLPTGASFFWASIGIRMFQALARTSFVVSSLTITAQLFPDHVALLGGLLETFAGFGYISGPVIGSALFELGGFIAPNFTMGLLMLLLGLGFACCTTLTRNCWGDGKKTGGKIDCQTPSNMCRSRQPSGSWKGTLRLQQCPNGDLENPYINSSPADNADSSSSSEDNSSDADSTGISTPSIDECENAVEKGSSPKKLKKHSVGFRSVLRQGPTWLIMFVISLRGITCSFYQAPLPEHLVSLNNSALLVGAVLMVQSVAYFVSAPIWGILVERLHTRRLPAATLITLGGSLLAIGSTLLMGPFPLAQIQKSIPSMTASFALLGFSAAALYIPVFQQCADISRRESTEQDQTRVYAILFSLVQSSSTLGSFVGNIGGGFGAQHFGFPWTCSIVALSHLIFAIFLSTYTVISSSK